MSSVLCLGLLDVHMAYLRNRHAAERNFRWKYMNPMRLRNALLVGLSLMCSVTEYPLQAATDGVAAGIPEPDNRNVIVQLFNWRFTEIRQVLPQ
jgi:hypothetical protein